MAMEYKAFSGGKEIDSFYSNGKELQEIWGGDTLFWKKSGIKIRRNVANDTLDGALMCANKAGNTFFALLNVQRNSLDSLCVATFSASDGQLFKKVIYYREDLWPMVTSCGDYFYIMTSGNKMQKVYYLYEYAGDGTLVSKTTFETYMPDYQGIKPNISGFYINEYGECCVIVKYHGNKVHVQTIILSGNSKTAYYNGLVSKLTGLKSLAGAEMTDQFYINGKRICASFLNALTDITSYDFKAIDQHYVYLCRNGNRIFCVDNSTHRILYEYDGTNFARICSLQKDYINTRHNIISVTILDGDIIILFEAGDNYSSDNDYKIVRVNIDSQKVELVPYEIESTAKYIAVILSGVEAHNGKLYVGKFYTWYPSTYNMVWRDPGLDEVSFPE